jgi:hypothetical protein
MNVYRMLTFLAAASVASGVSATASADSSLRDPPSGPGTEAMPGTRYHREHVVEGFQIGAQLGAGFTDPYGLGLGGRVGYTFLHGVYLGGAVTHYFGNTVDTPTGSESAHATFLGGELGYAFFPSWRWELRPYVFLGPSWITTVNPDTFTVVSKTQLAVQPGVLVAYHFGDVFLSAEGKFHVAPDPTAFALLGGVGIGLE